MVHLRQFLLLAFWSLLFLSSELLHSQVRESTDLPILNGYKSTVSGVDFEYHSSIPIARESLLIRATDGTSSMEWLTEAVPTDYQQDSVKFAWLAGIGSSPGDAAFDLAINGIPQFTFRSDGSDHWSYTSPSGARLTFYKDMVDQHGDRFGFMYLTLPYKPEMAGKAQQLKVTGQKYGKTSWYMTFRFPISRAFSIKSLPAIRLFDGQEYQLCTAGLLHTGSTSFIKIEIDNQLVIDTVIHFGYNYLKMYLPYREDKKEVSYRLQTSLLEELGTIPLDPVKKWRVNFVQHAHTDIGYTRSQTEILGEHLRYIDYALDYCDLTDTFPDAARFRWTCEASWAVDEYLKSRPKAQIERLKKRVAEGRIEITGMFFNFSELPDEQVLAASLLPISTIHDQGMQVKTAMQNDVNGIAWNLIDMYNDLGVEYVNMGTHGHRALICFDKPTLFWWEAPSGKRLLAYRAEHYMLGNTRFKIHAGDFNVFEDELLTYLQEQERKGYPYDLISLQHSGFLVDNSPPSMHASEMIRLWNEKYEWPKLKTAGTVEFFDEMKQKHAADFEVICGAWPDWWTDGFGASAREVAAIRQAQKELTSNTAGAVMAMLAGQPLPADFRSDIIGLNESLLFYTEHTVGYHASVREPFHPYTMEQRAIKESYAWEAARRARMMGEEVAGLLTSLIPKDTLPSLIVFNSLNWSRSEIVKVYIDHQIIPRFTSFTIEDVNGKVIPAQAIEYHSDGTYWLIRAEEIPAFGYKKFLIHLHPEIPFSPVELDRKALSSIENQFYSLTFDTLTGTLSSWKDKASHTELIDPDSEWKFGQFILEKPDNREQMESLNLTNFTREASREAKFTGLERSPLFTSIRYSSESPALFKDTKLITEYRLYNNEPRLEVLYQFNKQLNTDPEGIYAAFPFKLENAIQRIEVPGGEIRAGIDQIKGSSNDWNTIQNYLRISGDDFQLIISSLDAPLFQLGDINTGRFKAGAQPASTHVFGWPMNNYWTTNFNADQHGGHSFCYQFSSCQSSAMADAVHNSWSTQIPVIARILPAASNLSSVSQPSEGSFILGFPDNVALISAQPLSKDAVLLQIRELEGKEAEVILKNGLTDKKLTLVKSDLSGKVLAQKKPVIRPFETAFFKLSI